jgi:hypothetical protein
MTLPALNSQGGYCQNEGKRAEDMKALLSENNPKETG